MTYLCYSDVHKYFYVQVCFSISLHDVVIYRYLGLSGCLRGEDLPPITSHLPFNRCLLPLLFTQLTSASTATA